MIPGARRPVFVVSAAETTGIFVHDLSMKLHTKLLAAIVLLVASYAFLYWDVVASLVNDWAVDDNYSHGFLIVPVALYFIWERRGRLGAAVPRPSVAGLVLVIGCMALLVAGVLGAELFLTRVSLLGTVVGAVLFIYGKEHLKILIFPIAFLILMIPIPSIIFNHIAFPLQLLASRFGELALQVAQIPVLREGNVLILAHASLEVVEACSGIRSLISLLTLGIVYGYFTDQRPWVRTTIAAATIPVAIVANGLRIAGTGIAAHRFGQEVAEGFFHTFSGWLVFLAAFCMLFLVQRLVVWLVPQRGTRRSAVASGAAEAS